MLYCSNCGKKIDEKKVEAKLNSLVSQQNVINDQTVVVYVCPRCEHIIHRDLDENDVKQLSRAAHAEIQRSNNFFSSGMGNVVTGVIALAIAIIFYCLSIDLQNQMILDTQCAEFYVFIVLTVIGGAMFIVGLVLAIFGAVKKHHYYSLLDDIKNKTFIQ